MVLLCFSLPFAVFFYFLYYVLFHCYIPNSWFYLPHYLSVFLYSVHICLSVTYYSFSWHVNAHIHICGKFWCFQNCCLTSDVGFFFSHSEATSVTEWSPATLLKTGTFPGKEVQMMESWKWWCEYGGYLSSERELTLVTA